MTVDEARAAANIEKVTAPILILVGAMIHSCRLIARCTIYWRKPVSDGHSGPLQKLW